MTPVLSRLLLVFLGIDFAWPARKDAHAARRTYGHQGGRSGDMLSAKHNTDRTKVIDGDSSTSHAPLSAGLKTSGVLPDNSLDASMGTSSAFLEHSSVLMHIARGSSFFVGRISSLVLASYAWISAFLAIISVMVFCMLFPSKDKTSGRDIDAGLEDSEAEVDSDELIKRLSQSLPMCQLNNSTWSSCGASVEQRHIAMWWEKDSHTFASTKLGWWESKRHYCKRGRALDGFLLRDISEVKQTDTSSETDGALGVSIIYESLRLGRRGKVLFFFKSEELATHYAEDLKMLVRRVKADEEERMQMSPNKTSV